MPFVDEKCERMLVEEFAKICGVKPQDVECEVIDRIDEQGIRLKAHSELKDESRDTEVYIKMLGKNKFQISGHLTITGRATKKWDINQEFTGNVYSLPRALHRLLSVAKVKRSLLFRYLG